MDNFGELEEIEFTAVRLGADTQRVHPRLD